MFKRILEVVREEFSGEAAKEYVLDLTRYHRIQASPGFREAARYCERRLREFALKTRIVSFPADRKTTYWSFPMFQEWDATEATLHLIEPAKERRKLADFREVKNSLIQRSAPFSGTAEVVLLEDGEELTEYEGLALKGKIVFTKGDVQRVYDLAVVKYGAIGIITDGMREFPPVRQPMDIPDAFQYTSFWWIEGRPKCFGFVLSPKEGERLRRLLKKGRPVKVRAEVKSKLYDGKMEVVSGLIPGKTDGEVLLIAHLCHPQPSANDNASGCGALLEVARVVNKLVLSQKLRKPKRSIRFLLVPEMTGTYAWLATNEKSIPRVVAGLNLDMVGENQDKCGSSLLLIGSPGSNPSFAEDLLQTIFEETGREGKGLGGLGSFPLFRLASMPYTGGSDHYILADPSVGIPCPMVNQWPDKFYHTSEDTPDKVDPKMLSRVGISAAVYVYFLANAGKPEAHWLGREMVARFKGNIARAAQDGATDVLSTKKAKERTELFHDMSRRVGFLVKAKKEGLRSLRRLARVETEELEKETEFFASTELRKTRSLLRPQAHKAKLTGADRRAARLVPKRVYPGPVSVRAYIAQLTDEEQEEWYQLVKEKKDLLFNLLPSALYWADGKKNLLEIADLLELELGKRDVELMVKYFQLLGKLKLARLREKTPSRRD